MPLPVISPRDKLLQYFSTRSDILKHLKNATDCETCEHCFATIVDTLKYSYDEIRNIEISTRGQSHNPNWHVMRTGIITASKSKTVCRSKNFLKTAESLIQGNTLNEDNLPAPILFGRKSITFQSMARSSMARSLSTQVMLEPHCASMYDGVARSWGRIG